MFEGIFFPPCERGTLWSYVRFSLDKQYRHFFLGGITIVVQDLLLRQVEAMQRAVSGNPPLAFAVHVQKPFTVMIVNNRARTPLL